jgi:hypothetical protein
MGEVYLLDSTLTSIGDAIRSKKGTSDLILPSDMATEINKFKIYSSINMQNEADTSYYRTNSTCKNQYCFWNWTPYFNYDTDSGSPSSPTSGFTNLLSFIYTAYGLGMYDGGTAIITDKNKESYYALEKDSSGNYYHHISKEAIKCDFTNQIANIGTESTVYLHFLTNVVGVSNYSTNFIYASNAKDTFVTPQTQTTAPIKIGYDYSNSATQYKSYMTIEVLN